MSNTFLDSSSNALTVTRNGNVAQGSFSPYNQNTVADSGWSTYFDGTGDYLSLPSNAAFDFTSGDITIEAWIYVNSLSTVNVIAGTHFGANDQKTAMYVYSDGRLGIGRVALNEIAAPAGTVSTGVWTHVAFVRSGSTTTIYRNGVSVASATTAVWTSGASQFYVGYANATNGSMWNGYISNLRVVKGTALYTSAFTPSTTPLTAVANTALLACHTTTLVDGSTNAFTITKNGDTKVSSVSPFDVDAGRWSTFFDGNGDSLSVPQNAALQFGTADFTIECWIYPTTALVGCIYDARPASTQGAYPVIYINTDSTIRYFVSGADRITSSAIALNTWNHVAVARSGTSTRMFINGVQSGSTYTDSTNYTAGATFIGAAYSGGASITSFFNGYISNVRVIKGTTLYTANFNPSTTPLTAVTNTVLLTCQDAIFDDVSTNNFAITRNGDARTSTFSPYSPYTSGFWSAQFDGSSSLSIPASANNQLTGDFTIEGWILPSSAGDRSLIVQQSGSSYFALNVNAGTGFNIYLNSTSPSMAITDRVPVVGQWNHVALTRSGSTIRLFLNGVASSTTATSSSTLGYNALFYVAGIGTPTPSTGGTVGYISNLRLVKDTALYTSAFTPSTTPLTAVSGTTLLTLNDNRFRDNSLYQRAITRNGDVRVSASVPFLTPNSYSKTLNGGSAYFDGTGDYLSVANNSAFQFGTGNFTIEMWANIPSSSTTHGLIAATQTGSGYWASLISSNVLYWQSVNGSTNLTSVSYANYYNQWTHIAFVRLSGVTRIFLNGVQVASAADTSNYNGTLGSYEIGRDLDNSALLSGYLSDVNVVKGQALYTSNFVPPKSRIADAGASLLLNFANTSVTDFSAKNNIEMLGNVALNTTTKKFGTSSIYFPGSAGDQLKIASNPDLQFGTSDFTVEFWMYTSDAAADVISKRASGGYGSFGIYISPANTITGYVSTTGSSWISTGTRTFTNNTWTHVALVRSGTNLILFVDGVASTSGNVSTSALMTETNSVVVGGSAGNGDFAGYIDDLRITKGVARYTTSFTVPTSALTSDANTSLLVGQNSYFKDNSSANRTLTVAGNTVVNYRHPFSTPTGYWSNYFDGTGDFLSFADNSAFDIGLSGQAFTLEGWFNLHSLSTTYLGLQRGGGTAGWNSTTGHQYQLFYYAVDNKIYFQNWTGSAVNSTTSQASPVTANTWNHIAVCYDGTTTRMFLNGNLVASSTINYAKPSSSNITRLGTTSAANENGGACYVSNFRLIKGTALYTANFTPSTTPLTAVSGTSLLTCQDSTLKDNSSNAFTITKNGNVVSDQFSPYMRDAGFWSAAFDGNGDFLNISASSSLALGSGDFTIECWFYAGKTGDHYLFDMRTASGIYVYLDNTSLNYIAAQVGSTGQINAGTYASNTWNHFAVVRSGSGSNNVSFYLNGVRTTQATDTTNYSTNTPIFIGRRHTDFSGAFGFMNGYISNFRVVKGTALYTSAFTPSTTPLTAIAGTSLLTCRDLFLTDSSAQGNAITVVGDTKVSNLSASGQYSAAFDGTGDYLSVNDGSWITLGSSDFTAECWIYNTVNTGASQYIFGQGQTTAASVSLEMFIQADRTVMAGVYVGSQKYATSTATIPLNTWTHVALVRDGGNIRLYINGVQDGVNTTAGSSSVIDQTSQFSIGRGGEYNGLYFNGYVSNFRFVKGTCLYTGGTTFTPSTTSLTAVANTALLTCANSSLSDLSTNALTVTKNGNATSIASSPFDLEAGRWSNYFDGTGDYLSIAGSSAFDFGTGNFTIEMWVYFSSYGTSAGFLVGQNFFSSVFQLDTTGKLQFYSQPAAAYVVTGATAVPKNQWNHVALSRDGNTFRVFLNGSLDGSGTDTNAAGFNSSYELRIAAWNALTATWVGYLSNFRLVKGTAVYTSAFTPPTAPLTAITNTSLLTCQDNRLRDNSTNNFTITRNGDVRPAILTPFAPASGKYSVQFDGNGDTLTIPQNSVFNLGTGAFTVEAWVYYNGFGTNTGIINLGQGASSSAFCGWTLLTNNSGGFRFYRYDGSVETNFSVNYTFTTGVWYHICVVRNASSNFSMYVNGSRVYNQTVTTSFNNINSDPVYIGAFRSGSGGGAWAYHNGYISNVRVVNGTAVYDPTQTSINAPTSSLTAVTNTVLLTAQDSTIKDNSGLSLTVTKNGDVKSHWQSPFFLDGKWSMYFDGNGDYLTVADNPSLDMGSSDFTIEGWYYPTGNASISTALLSKRANSSTVGGVLLYYGATGLTPSLLVDTGGSWGINSASSIAFTANVWNHFAITRSGSTFRLFINGALALTATSSASIPDNSSAFAIGAMGVDGSGAISACYMSNIRVVKGTALYTGGFTPPTETFPTKGVNV